jgi:hypothetical protein
MRTAGIAGAAGCGVGGSHGGWGRLAWSVWGEAAEKGGEKVSMPVSFKVKDQTQKVPTTAATEHGTRSRQL